MVTSPATIITTARSCRNVTPCMKLLLQRCVGAERFGGETSFVEEIGLSFFIPGETDGFGVFNARCGNLDGFADNFGVGLGELVVIACKSEPRQRFVVAAHQAAVDIVESEHG